MKVTRFDKNCPTKKYKPGHIPHIPIHELVSITPGLQRQNSLLNPHHSLRWKNTVSSQIPATPLLTLRFYRDCVEREWTIYLQPSTQSINMFKNAIFIEMDKIFSPSPPLYTKKLKQTTENKAVFTVCIIVVSYFCVHRWLFYIPRCRI